ncbi:MAG TPA: hypothetical protein V6C76_13960 [Drouetiella sp.]
MPKRSDDDFDWFRGAMGGMNLSPEQALNLEKQVDENPANKSARATLLGYYSSRPRKLGRAAREKQARHILWVLEFAPACGLGVTPALSISKADNPKEYDLAKQIILIQCKKYRRSAAVISDLALALRDESALSINLLRDAYAIAPKKMKYGIAFWLAALLHRQGLETANSQDLNDAVALMQEIFREKKTGLYACRLAQYALNGNQYKLARETAEQMLQDYPDDNQCIHEANIVLGLIALNAGEIATAKDRLLIAGRVGKSPRLVSYGPIMNLAQRFLELGERSLVIQYLTDCKGFWEMGPALLRKWINEIESGAMPVMEGDRFS